jgi:hypothetical protein
MTKSQNRVEARQEIQERAIARRPEREKRDERIAELALAVNVALRTGRRVRRPWTSRARNALTEMIDAEGLTATGAINWVGRGPQHA